MIKRRKRERFGTRQETRIRCPAHLAWVRGHECAIAGKYFDRDMDGRGRWPHRCEGKVIAAHVRTGTDGAAGIKPSDCWVIPLCESMTGGAHKAQHNWGEATFERRYGIDMKAIAAQLWRASPHRIRYERRIRERKERTA